ncbi:unnamed protein product, partial [marine sediment metagenome]
CHINIINTVFMNYQDVTLEDVCLLQATAIRYAGYCQSVVGPVENNAGTPSYYKNGVLITSPTRFKMYDEIVSTGDNLLVSVDNIDMTAWQNKLNFGGYTNAAGVGNYRARFMMHFDSDQSANRTAIEDILNEYYNIF